MNMKLVETCLLIIAIVVGVANYKGLSMTFDADWSHKVYAAIIAVAVSSMTFAMWHGAFQTAPKLNRFVHRMRGWAITLVGCVFLLAFSAYWSIISLGGNEALRHGYANVVATGEAALAQGAAGGTDFQGIRSQLSGLEGDARAMARCEEERGCLTGSPGAGGVGSVMTMLADAVEAQISALDTAASVRRGAHVEGKACLDQTRAAVALSTAAAERGPRLAVGIDCLNTAIASLHGDGVTQGIIQALRSLTAVALPPTVKTDRQKHAATGALATIKAKADAIVGGLETTVAARAFEPVPMPPANAAIAVLVNWKAIIPAWATAIALDLAPLLLLAFQSAIMASRRHNPDAVLDDMTVGQLLAMRKLMDRLDGRSSAPATISMRRGRTGTYGMADGETEASK